MTAPSFLEFRPCLASASGFQSVQFKLLEMRMGLSVEDRLSLRSNTYTSTLSASDRDIVESAASSSNLLSALDKWLSIHPLHIQIHSTFWPRFTRALSSLSPEQSASFADIIDPEKHKVLVSKGLRRLSLSAMRSAVAIMSLYRKDQSLALSFSVLSLISEMDALMSKWRFHHASMVHRVLGTTPGTGGSSGVSYLHMTCTRHMVFNDINNVNQYLIPSLMLESPSGTTNQETLLKSPSGFDLDAYLVM